MSYNCSAYELSPVPFSHSHIPPKIDLQAEPEPSLAIFVNSFFDKIFSNFNAAVIAKTKAAIELAEEAHPLAIGKVLILSILIFNIEEDNSLHIGMSKEKNFLKIF